MVILNVGDYFDQTVSSSSELFGKMRKLKRDAFQTLRRGEAGRGTVELLRVRDKSTRLFKPGNNVYGKNVRNRL